MESGFTIELSSRAEGWWRYNAALLCGCFDAAGQRIGFASTASDVAPVGSGLTRRPEEVPADRRVVLRTPPCDRMRLCVYLIPHALPEDNDIDAVQAFDIELSISYGDKLLSTERRKINPWSGASIELNVSAEP